MSDSDPDEALSVVSASLLCSLPPLVPDVNESTQGSDRATLPFENLCDSSSVNVNADTSTFYPELQNITGSDRNVQNIEEISSETPAEQDKDNCCGNAGQRITNIIKFELKHYANELCSTRDNFDDKIVLNNHDKIISNNTTTDLISDDASKNDKNKNFDIIEQVTKENRLAEDNFSGSTDGTLQNSDESSDLEGSVGNKNTQDSEYLFVRNSFKMGNKQSQAPKVQSDDDTPDDGRTKCCQVPKRKLKEKGSRSNRTSRNDDLNFDSNEVYPFEGRSRSEQEINEPVELEPFEIVETDDIKFVPGAGTSDVIKSFSEPRFTTITEESPLSEDIQDHGTSSYNSVPTVPFYIEKGNKLIEPGTATAHSTFEFKQGKPKSKICKVTQEHRQHNYENVSRIDESAELNISGRKTSSSSSKSNSSAGSKDASRKNSKDAIQKPSRKGKSKTPKDLSDSSLLEKESKDNKTKSQKEQKSQSVRDSEIDRNIDNVLMLTQTMFSQTKVTEDHGKEQSMPFALNQYENVGVCAKLEPSGIVIRHKDTNVSDRPFQETTQNSKNDVTCTGNNCGEPKEINKRRNHYSNLSKDIVEISESGTLIIKSLADLPSDLPSTEEVEVEQIRELSPSESLSSNDNNDITDLKVPYETIDRLSVDNKIDKIDTESNADDKETVKLTENVPPPSPLAMGMLQEEAEEEYEEDDDNIDHVEEDRRKSEILEFTENVCKRLSHLLENMSGDDDDDDNYNNEGDKEGENGTSVSPKQNSKKYEDHIYETIDGLSKLESLTALSENNIFHCDNENCQEDESYEHFHDICDSACDLKCVSVVAENCNNQQKPAATSDDDLPEYFDPRQLPTPEIKDDFESFKKDSLISEEVSNVESTNKMSYLGLQYDNVVIDKKDKNFSLSIKSFENELINDVPPSISTEDLRDITPTAEAHPKHTALPELANAEEETPVQFDTSGRQSATCTESDIDVSEHRDDLSTDSMLADDEAEETMEILFTKTYTEPVEGAEVFLSCTVVNSAYKDEKKKSETWLSDEALEYFEANASEVMSTAFLKAKKEMKDIQICLQSLRQQMEHFHSDCDDISLPEIPVDSLSPDYFGIPMRKAVTD